MVMLSQHIKISLYEVNALRVSSRPFASKHDRRVQQDAVGGVEGKTPILYPSPVSFPKPRIAQMTKSLAIVPLTVLVALGLCACTPKAQNEVSEAANAVAADANATAAQAVDDTDAALGAAESRIDNAGAVLGNKADRIADKTGAALKDVGNEIED
jgi:hypothetical protein